VDRLWHAVRRTLVVLVVVVLVLVIATGGLLTWLVVRGFPQREGTATLPGLSANVRVVRDQYGITNIYAATTADLFAAQGYVHASERMWQMEVWRHIGAGRLAELFGKSQVDNDAFIRTLGWRKAAEADWSVMSADGKIALEAYARGVNAWLDQHGDLPLPFVVTGLQGVGGGLSGYRPEPWTPIDTLTWQKVQAWSLGSNWDSELFRMLAAHRGLSAQQIADLFPTYDPTRPVIVEASSAGTTPDRPAAIETSIGPSAADATSAADAPSAASLLTASDSLRSTIAMATNGSDLAGSNGFVVAPSRSASGGALLANDPHLDISMPSVWYLIGLHCDPVGPACPYELAGAGFPGVPGIVLGHNDRIAWGLTNVGPDVQDLFDETVDPADPTHYLYKGQSRPFDVRAETIKVAGGADVTLNVRSTVHGPVVSDVAYELKPKAEDGAELGQPGHVYALEWTATIQPDRTLDSVLAVNRAQDWNEFREALRNFGAPSQTFLYADIDGHIGVQIPGLIPIRAGGAGSYPAPGADGSHDWTGFVPFDDLPSSYDPPSGVIVASNNKPVAPDYKFFLGQEWDPGYRSARIHQLLDAAGSITTDTLRSIQGDVMLTRAAPVIDNMDGAAPQTADGQLLKQRIREWRADPTCTTDSLGCAAYETFEYRLLRGIFDDELGAGYEPENTSWRYVGTELSHELLSRLVTQPDNAWWDDTSTAAVTETRDDIMSRALDAAAADLRAGLGDPAGWTWGRIHTVRFDEVTLGESGIGPLEALFDKGPYPAPGSCTTVDKVCGSIAQSWPQGSDPANLQQMFAAGSSPSYRLAIDMSNLDGATIIQTTGQSGLPFDAHYGDFIDRWLSNSPLPLPWTSAKVDATTKQQLTLSP
jgi:penicillin amidase